MARETPFGAVATSTVLFLLVLLQAALVWEEARSAPAKRNDILAGTEFLSVFINGAMATPPQRRRGFRRGGHAAPAVDSATSETQHEASIYRISQNPNGRPIVARTHGANGREEVVRFYPISQRTLENRQQNLASLIDDLSTAGEVRSTNLTPYGSTTRAAASSRATTSTTSVTSTTSATTSRPPAAPRERPSSRSNGTSRGVSQKVIGVSVTSTVEATPYKVRVEHYDTDSTVITRPPVLSGSTPREVSRESRRSTARTSTTRSNPRSSSTASTSNSATSTSSTSPTTLTTPLPAHVVTEELSNIVSESNRSEFTVDEGSPRTSWRGPGSATPRSTSKRTSAFPDRYRADKSAVASEETIVTDADDVDDANDSNDSATLPSEVNYELPEEDSEPREFHEEPPERAQPQGRKAGRHYDASHYNRPGAKHFGQPLKSYKPARTYGEPAKVYGEPAKVYGEPERVYGEPAKVYSEPAKVYSEPAKVYSEPAKIYSEPAKVYGEPEKVYSEPSKVYSEPAKVYSEPAKVYSQPARVYGEPSKVYDAEGHPVSRERGGAGGGGEPDEQNYEVDESASVGSNGNVHGPQLVITETPGAASEVEDGHKVGYVVEGRNYRKYQVEERTPDGFIVGEYGVVSHDDGSLRGVRYTADGSTNPRLIYETLMKFLAL